MIVREVRHYKTCTNCMEMKILSEYYKQNKAYDKHQAICKKCSKEKQKKYRGTQKGRSRSARRVMWDKIFIEKGGAKCIRCGIEHEAPIFDLHHRDPSAKLFSVGRGVKNWEIVKEEIKKCDLLCACCHRIVHWEEHKLKEN